MSAPVLIKKPSPSQINLIKNAQNHFLLLYKFKNNSSAQLCSAATMTSDHYVQILEFPWMAYLLTYVDANMTVNFSCSGTLISQEYILSAAHCFCRNDMDCSDGAV